MNEFNNTIRYQYTKEYNLNIIPKIIQASTPIDFNKYDKNGFNKYHIVDVKIQTNLDLIQFKSYKEILLKDIPYEEPILIVPDNYLEITMAENLQINFGLTGTGIVPFNISPFSPENNEILLIYFTTNTHIRINNNYHMHIIICINILVQLEIQNKWFKIHSLLN